MKARSVIRHISAAVLLFGTITLNAQPQLKEHQVSPDGMSAVFSFYNTTPESPDGKVLVYVRCKKEPYGREESVPGELWTCTRDLENHRKLADIDGTVAHNGVEAQWIDNDRIVFFDKGRIRIVAARTGKDLLTKKISCAGLGHYPINHKILYNIYSGEGTGEPGIYELDGDTFETKLVLSNADIAKIPLPSFLPGDQVAPVKDWRALHCQYAPDGKKIAFRLDVGPFEEGQLQGICNRDGSGLTIMTQTLHSIWYDNGSLIGHLRYEKDGKKPGDPKLRFTLVRVDLEGNILQRNITPKGNHLCISPDRQWVASETFYQTNPVVFTLYPDGHPGKAIEIARYNPYDIVWKRRFHVNPAFSRDGKRLYYSRPLNEKYAGIFYYEIK
ncbi:TolB-like translocation protein [Niabella drilacis]|nr:PD40 domain-containing protein [Niabella drilacis]